MNSSMRLLAAVLFFYLAPIHAEPSLQEIAQRLEALEKQNEQFRRDVDALTQENKARRAERPQAPAAPAVQVAAAPDAVDEWASRIRFKGDFRFRRESIDSEAAATGRNRESIRARFGAQIKVNDVVEGEIAIATGGENPRGGSAGLGSAGSRKDIGLELGYMTWHPLAGVGLTAGKMRQPFVRPGFSAFVDNEIRPEGIAASYRAGHGLFGSAFRFWLEERSAAPDSLLTGAQVGWQDTLAGLKLMLGAGYYDHGRVRDQLTRFGGGVVNELGNSVTGAGATARYVYDYDVAQLFGEATWSLGEFPVSVFADYARNTAAPDDLDTAYNLGVLFGKASAPGRWEVGVLTQRVQKDALFGQWLDSDFAGGVTDSRGEIYQFRWMALKNVLFSIAYFDTDLDNDAGAWLGYEHLQADFNFTF